MKSTVKTNKAREMECYVEKYFLAGLGEGDAEQRAE